MRLKYTHFPLQAGKGDATLRKRDGFSPQERRGSMSQQTPRAPGSLAAERRRIVIITGLSGAGKSNALQAFEDAGYFCIDNLPPRMIPAVMETAAQGNGGPDGVVVVMDIRGRRYFGEELERSLEVVEKESGWELRILFIDSDDPTLVRRYKESRRPHPAAVTAMCSRPYGGRGGISRTCGRWPTSSLIPRATQR